MTLEATTPGANYGSTASGSSFYAAMRIKSGATTSTRFTKAIRRSA
jgi:hypothetical protein